VKVQGDNAVQEIIEAFEIIDKKGSSDLVILARGGGSLEDLQAFNDESVARIIHACRIPVISAVGHETDYTISDFVADLRAPTPSAAAELAVPVKNELEALIFNYKLSLQRMMANVIAKRNERLSTLRKRLKDPGRIVQDARMKLDDHTGRLTRTVSSFLKLTREKLERRIVNLHRFSPQQRLSKHKETLEQHRHNLLVYMNIALNKREFQYRETAARLATLDPKATLKRGYSITRTIFDNRIVNDPACVNNGQVVEITVNKGTFNARVEKEKR